MKRLVAMILFFCITPAAWGYVSVKIYEADGNTPFDGRDIMVGTRLVIVLDSNVAAGEMGWYNDLALTEDNINLGVLLGRDFNEATWNYDGSPLPAAGDEASAAETSDSEFNRISFFADMTSYAGKWFIVDYNAVEKGNCTIEFFEGLDSIHDPNRDTTFVQVPTRDFNKDTIVNFGDFAAFASYWRTDCGAPGGCNGADIDDSNRVDSNDLALFTDYWLEKTWYP